MIDPETGCRYSRVVEELSDMRGWTQEQATANTLAMERLLRAWDYQERLYREREEWGQSDTSVTERVVAYLKECPPAVSGQGGHNQTFEVARAVVYGFDLGRDAGFDVLKEHYNPRCVPPWSDAELRHKCEDADTKPFNKERGYLLNARAPGDGASATGRTSEPVNGTTRQKSGKPKPEPIKFPMPIPASQLKAATETVWLWKGYLGRGEITLLSALWKSGKTTLLAHLLRALEAGGEFCGLPILAGRVLYVTEESEARWAKRRDAIGIRDHVEFIVRPFGARSDWDQWLSFVEYVRTIQAANPSDLIIFDTLADLWPVRDENDACQVQAAVKPLHKITGRAGLFLVHHHRKGDGTEATASRGSGALTAFVDTIMELRRFDPTDRNSRKRVLSGYGRADETTRELVIELDELDGYKTYGNRRETVIQDITAAITGLLPTEPPGATVEDIEEGWPLDAKPRRQRLLDALREGVDAGRWVREGTGRKGSPYTFRIDAAVI